MNDLDIEKSVREGTLAVDLQSVGPKKREKCAKAVIRYYMHNMHNAKAIDLPESMAMLSYDTPSQLSKVLSAAFRTQEAQPDLSAGAHLVFGWNSSTDSDDSDDSDDSEVLSGISWKNDDSSVVLSKITWA